MAHYALIDNNNVVRQVITGVDETVTQLDNGVEVGGSTEAWEQFYQNQPWHSGLICKRTSYNNNIRKQFAGPGMTYDPIRDEFVDIQPYASWRLDENNNWQPPIPEPIDGVYEWSESTQSWIELGFVLE